jgi:hypothetical protein
LKQPNDKSSSQDFETAPRKEIEDASFAIIANVGDQYSDLRGGHAERVFKVPNCVLFHSLNRFGSLAEPTSVCRLSTYRRRDQLVGSAGALKPNWPLHSLVFVMIPIAAMVFGGTDVLCDSSLSPS